MKQFFYFSLLTFVSISIGVLFIFSAYAKLFPIEPFEFTFVELGIANWRTAPFFARFLISLELFMGLLMLFCLYLNKFTLKLTISTLIFFNIYLVMLLFRKGDYGNCGCFGDYFAMTPSQALIKNSILLVFLFILLYKFIGIQYGKFSIGIATFFLLSSLAFPHIFNYVDFSYSKAYLNDVKINQTLPLDSLYSNFSYKKPIPNLNKGKKIVAFLSLTCPHCKIAARKIRIIKERNPELPFFFVLNGETEKLQLFFKETQTESIPYTMLLGRPFIFLAGTNLPKIYLLNNSSVEFVVNYLDLDQAEIEKWLRQ